MVEINEYLWECLYEMKAVYDHDPEAPVLQTYHDTALDGDDAFEFGMNAMHQFFADTRCYYDDDKDLEVTVFYDPIITDFWRLCEEYEAITGLSREKDPFRKELICNLESALYIPDYSYDARWYCDTKRRGGCRLVLLVYCDFCGSCYIPAALADAYDAFAYHTERLKKEMKRIGEGKLKALPSSDPLLEAA